jgi:hypothetical protein
VTEHETLVFAYIFGNLDVGAVDRSEEERAADC